jgi:hypothetical protein
MTRWALMWSVAFTLYAACKCLTWVLAPRASGPTWKVAAYLLAWPGMDAAAFFDPDAVSPALRPDVGQWILAGGRLILGATLFWCGQGLVPAGQSHALGALGMVGILLILHFGAFDLLSCCWRTAGIDARPIMDMPLAAASVGEFWGRRWNTAFRDLTHRFLFRPLTRRCGARAAILVGFLVSGLIHELVLTIPTGCGYGGPTLYFTIQGAALLAEHSLMGRRIGLGGALRGRLFTLITVFAPVGLLFQTSFLTEVIIPFMGAAGALR